MLQQTLADVSKRLTKDVIEEAFASKTNSKTVVEKVQVTRAAPIGEGLISAVYRIHVSGNGHNGSFIAKGLVKDELLRRTLNCSMYFKREVLFFSEILPALADLQRSLGANEKIQHNVPVCYNYLVDGANDYILMEDMFESGCKSISKTPSEFERNEVLRVLAHLHSVSMALRLTRPQLFMKMANELFEVYYRIENRSWYSPYLQRALEIDLDALAKDERYSNSIYFHKLKKMASEDPYDQLIELVWKRGDHAVFNHGDAWCSNFLCSEKSAVAIDFQLFRVASPATDLAYFILLCGNLCRNRDDFFEAVDVYYSHLSYYLRDMGMESNVVFTKHMLYDELKDYGKFGLLAAATSIPLLASERCDVASKFETEYVGVERIPLEKLWKLDPIEDDRVKECLYNTVRVAVDVGLI